jgi:hypothetical protein
MNKVYEYVRLLHDIREKRIPASPFSEYHRMERRKENSSLIIMYD